MGLFLFFVLNRLVEINRKYHKMRDEAKAAAALSKASEKSGLLKKDD
jgi:hypothetical protein